MSKRTVRMHKARGLLAMMTVLLASGVSGCSWDDSAYEDMVSAIGKSEPGSCTNISYIQLESGRVTVRCPRAMGTDCRRENLIVEGGDPRDYEKYLLNFNFAACPDQLACHSIDNSGEQYCSSAVCGVNTHDYAGFCENDTVVNCGSHGRSCSEIVSNWADGACIDGECHVVECNAGYKVVGGICVSDCATGQHYDNDSSTCVDDDINNCGKTGYVCSEQIKNSSIVLCTEGMCYVSECADGYAAHNNECVSNCNKNQHYDSLWSKCVDNDVDNCGQTGFACSQKVQNWETGSCVEGNCVVDQCTSGFKVVGNECKADCLADQHYDSQTAQCVTNDINNCGQTGFACAERVLNWMAGTCENGSCSVTSCAPGYKPSPNADACVSDCKVGQHYDSSKSVCVADDLNNCGQTGYSCLEQIKNAQSAICKDGKCNVVDCKKGYTAVNNTCASTCTLDEYYDSESATCKQNSLTSCGQKGYACASKISNWATGNCVNGSCLLLTCKPGYKVSNNTCLPDCTNYQYYDTNQSKCVTSSVTNCGRVGNDCSKLAGWEDGTCETNNCKAKVCSSGYLLKDGICEALIDCENGQHLYKGNCEADDINNCGTHGFKCSSLAGWDGGKCENSVCIASNCKLGYKNNNGKCEAENLCGPGYHIYNGGCEADSVNRCGTELIDCTKNPGWFDGVCSAGVCLSDWCLPNYHTKLGQCVVDSSSECGYSRENCNAKSATLSTAAWKCSAGYCVADVCNNDYKLSSENVCVPTSSGGSTETDCNCDEKIGSGTCSGSNVCTYNSCADGYYLNAGKCVACGCNSDGSLNNKCSDAGVCGCKTGYVGDKCDACDATQSYIDCNSDPSVLRCLKPSQSGWRANYTFADHCEADCASCKVGQTCNRDRSTGVIKCSGSVNY